LGNKKSVLLKVFKMPVTVHKNYLFGIFKKGKKSLEILVWNS